jgi:hypothetical protein
MIESSKEYSMPRKKVPTSGKMKDQPPEVAAEMAKLMAEFTADDLAEYFQTKETVPLKDVILELEKEHKKFQARKRAASKRKTQRKNRKSA